MIDICAVCEDRHEIELLKTGGDHGALYKVFKCVETGETWENIRTPRNMEQWAEMHLNCENKECGNIWCSDCTRVWKDIQNA